MLRRTLLLITLIAAGAAMYGYAASFVITSEIISQVVVISAADVPTTRVGGPDPLQSAPPAATDLAAVCPEEPPSDPSLKEPFGQPAEQPGVPGADPCGEGSSTDSGAPAVSEATTDDSAKAPGDPTAAGETPTVTETETAASETPTVPDDQTSPAGETDGDGGETPTAANDAQPTAEASAAATEASMCSVDCLPDDPADTPLP